MSDRATMSYKVLLVEDDATTADYIAKGLAEEGFTIDRAEDGREGLFMATEASHDAIILDRMLPGMDGMAVLAQHAGAEGVERPHRHLLRPRPGQGGHALAHLARRLVGKRDS